MDFAQEVKQGKDELPVRTPKTQKKGKKTSKRVAKEDDIFDKKDTKNINATGQKQKGVEAQNGEETRKATFSKKGDVIKEPKLAEQIEEKKVDDTKQIQDENKKEPVQQKDNVKNPLRTAMQNKTNTLNQSAGIAETEEFKAAGKTNKEDKAKNRQNTRARATETTDSKTMDSRIDDTKQTSQNQTTQAYQDMESDEAHSFEDFFAKGSKKGETKIREGEDSIESKESKKSLHQKQQTEASQNTPTSRTQILYRSAQARESMRNFAQSLREEVMNYKPPVTKLSLELNPQNLGTLELTLTKRGRDLHVQVVSNSVAMGLFLQNQADFKNNLAQVGFENVNLSFSTSDGSSGNGGQNGAQEQNQSNQGMERNENRLEEGEQGEICVMNITLPKYA